MGNGQSSIIAKAVNKQNISNKKYFNPRKTNNKILHCRPGGPPRPTFNFYTQAHLFVRFFEVDTPSYVK